MHPIVMQVAAQVAQAAADGMDRINIRLSPSDLGRIDVKLDFGPDGRVQAVFAAERPQTMELLQRDARDLERALQDAGLRADSGSLSFNLRGQGRDAQNGSTGNGGGHGGAPAEIAPQLQAYTAGYSGSGRLDIRI
jgi:flagellar hook-length control protein FliK